MKSCQLCQGFETFTWMGQLTSISNCKLHNLKPSQFYCVGWKNLHATCRFVGVFNTNYSVYIPTASLLYLPVAFIILWMQSLSVRIKVFKISSNITMNCSSFAGIICTLMLAHTFENLDLLKRINKRIQQLCWSLHHVSKKLFTKCLLA